VDDLLYIAERRVLAGVSVFYPAPGSADFDLCRRLDLLPTSLGRMRSSALPIEHTTQRVESATLLRLGRILDFMKFLRDRGLAVPQARRPRAAALDPSDRIRAGRELLAWFLSDGRIRGLAPDGQAYEHRVEPNLTERFLNGFNINALRGAL
jgi:hypothetical protein